MLSSRESIHPLIGPPYRAILGPTTNRGGADGDFFFLYIVTRAFSFARELCAKLSSYKRRSKGHINAYSTVTIRRCR
jgi:hypothetical protein